MSIKNLACAILIFLQAAVVACGKSKNADPAHDTVIKAYQLIDADRDDEAIQLLESALKDQPDNRDFRSVLASAYAHKGSFKMQKFLPLFKNSKDYSTVVTSLKQQIRDHENNPAADKLDTFSLKVTHLLLVNANFFRLYTQIPGLRPEDVPYIQYAIEVLDGFGDKISADDALYRAVLRVLLFKNYFSEKLAGEFRADASPGKKCTLDLTQVNDKVIIMSRMVIDILRDLSIANPSKAQKYTETTKEIADITSDVTVALTTITVIDEGAQLFFKQLAIQNELGKLMTCK